MKFLLIISLLMNVFLGTYFYSLTGLVYDMGWSHGLERGCWNAAYRATNKNADEAARYSTPCFTENLQEKVNESENR